LPVLFAGGDEVTELKASVIHQQSGRTLPDESPGGESYFLGRNEIYQVFSDSIINYLLDLQSKDV
jgi:hypothetical protein